MYVFALSIFTFSVSTSLTTISGSSRIGAELWTQYDGCIRLIVRNPRRSSRSLRLWLQSHSSIVRLLRPCQRPHSRRRELSTKRQSMRVPLQERHLEPCTALLSERARQKGREQSSCDVDEDVAESVEARSLFPGDYQFGKCR